MAGERTEVCNVQSEMSFMSEMESNECTKASM